MVPREIRGRSPIPPMKHLPPLIFHTFRPDEKYPSGRWCRTCGCHKNLHVKKGRR